MEELLQCVLDRLNCGNNTVLAVVLGGDDGTPRKRGAKMLVGEEGNLLGTVGGGNIEFEAVQTAKELLKTGGNLVRDYVLRLEGVNNAGMVCGGDVKILFTVLTENARPWLEDALTHQKQKKTYWLELPLVQGEGRVKEEVPFHAAPDIYRERFLHEGRVFVFGGGHVAKELVPLLDLLDFRVIVLDDREDFVNQARFPQAEQLHCVDYEAIPDLGVSARDLVVIMTRGHQFDLECQRYALKTEACYIGVMGSRKKAAYIRSVLESDGFAAAELDRIITPIGLSIGSETPREIAVSILAQLIQVRADQK